MDARPLEVRVRIAVRWRDLDMLGHLNQAVYHEFLEEARGALVERLAALGTGFTFVLARVELDYRQEVTRGDREVDATCRVAAVGRSSITVEQSVVRTDRTVAAEGRSILVAWDMRRRRSRALTDEERAALTTAAAA